MNLTKLCAARAAERRPVTAGLIGAGKYGSMFLEQVPHVEGLEVATIADLDPDRATGHPRAGIRHAQTAISAGRHEVMVNVEADQPFAE